MKNSEKDKLWYRDPENHFDVFVWLNERKNIVRFQFWYEDYLIEWNLGGHYRTGQLDSESVSFQSYQAPSYLYHKLNDFSPLKEICEILSNSESKISQIAPLHFVFSHLKSCL